MISKFQLFAFCVITMLAAQPLSAESLYVCPEISKAKQVADCPPDEELKIMFLSTCGTNAKENTKAIGQCSSFDAFKQKKNTALWESEDGAFSGYVSCDLPASKIKQSKLASVGLSTHASIDKITCSYDGGAKLALRTREACAVKDGKVMGRLFGVDCREEGADCKVTCQ